MQAAAILFGLAALGGLVMAFLRWSGAPRPPDWLAMGHGLLAAAGLQDPSPGDAGPRQ